MPIEQVKQVQELQIIARVPADLHEAVKMRAREDDLSIAQVVRRALKLYINSEETRPLTG